jgi:hypothetical protein
MVIFLPAEILHHLHELKNNHCYIFLVRKSVAPTTSSFYV